MNFNKSELYSRWRGIKRRCYEPDCDVYKWYGALGVTIHEPWRENFDLFRKEVPPFLGPEYELDRIDPFGNYEPGNVRWVTHEVNVNNRRCSKRFDFQGQRLTLTQISKLLKINYPKLYYRVIDLRRPLLQVIEELETLKMDDTA